MLNSKSDVEITDKDGHTKPLETSNIVIATGARPSLILGIPVDGQKVLTYREPKLQEKPPTLVVIIGGGAIGVEFATFWNAYGSEVTIVEMLSTLVPREDEEIGTELTLAHNAELTIEEIARNVHAHLSLAEVIMEVAHGMTGGYIHN